MRALAQRRAALPRRIAADRDGAVAIQFAILLAALIGFASLATEIGLLMLTSRHMQATADAAALAAATAYGASYPADYTQEAFALSAAAGFADGQQGTTVTVHRPPATGAYTGNNNAVEVLIGQAQNLPLARVIYSGAFAVGARAVAVAGGNGSCVLALDPTAGASFAMNGGTVANLVNCDVSVNSNSPQAVSLVGGSVLNAGRLYDVGGYSQSGGSQINAVISSNAPATADPYAAVAMPMPAAACDNRLGNVKTATNASPGTYCSITVSSASLALAPGTYFLKGGDLTVKAGASLTGSGVTIVLTGSGGNYATVNVASNSTVNLSAPSTGATAGLVFFQDRSASASGSNMFSGGATQTLTGALYFPNQAVNFGGGTASSITCIEIVARTLTFVGNATLKVDCAGTGVLPIGSSGNVVLVE